MNNTLIFLRHGKTEQNPNAPVSNWNLSKEGEEEAERIAASGLFDKVDIVICSEEKKSQQTAAYIVSRIKKMPIIRPRLNELNRDNGGMLTPNEHDRTLEFALKNPDKSEHFWETANSALQRYQFEISQINNEHANQIILIVSHGIVMSLYFAKLLGKLKQVSERERELKYCAYGIVKENKIIKDIV